MLSLPHYSIESECKLSHNCQAICLEAREFIPYRALLTWRLPAFILTWAFIPVSHGTTHEPE